MRKKQKTTYMTLWHVTHKDNVQSILECGIDPICSKSEFKRIWLVRWWGLAWIIFHLSMLKRTPAWQFVIFKVRVNSKYITHFNRQVYTCKRTLYPSMYMTSEQVLSAIERQREFKRRVSRPPVAPARVENDLSWLGE